MKLFPHSIALVAGLVLAGSTLAQEPKPDAPLAPNPAATNPPTENPAPATPPELPKKPDAGRPALPGEDLLIPEPVLDSPRRPRSVREQLKEPEPEPVTEPPEPEPIVLTDADLLREVAMSQALSTGETLLASLGGLTGLLTSPFLPNQYRLPLSEQAKLRPLRWGSLDVNANTSLGISGTHVGGELVGDNFETTTLFQAGVAAMLGRNTLSSLWMSYDIGTSYPENPAQGRQLKGSSSAEFDHSLSLVARVVFPELRKMRFVFGLRYASLSGFDRDTGESEKRQIATGWAAASYQHSLKTSFDWDVSFPVRQFSGDGVSSSGITGTLFAHNQITKKTRLGLGYSVGKVDVDDGESQIYHQALLRLKYRPTRFVSCDATLGLDFRDAADSLTTTPIFGLSVIWDSESGTSVSLAAERRVFNAASAINTNFTSTSIVLSGAQRLGWGLIGTLAAGYEFSEYESIGAGGQGSRKDHLTFVSGGLVKLITHHWNVSLSCAAGINESDTTAFDFVQVTLKTALAF